MFPFLRYLETSVKNCSAGILGQETEKDPNAEWCGILPRLYRAGGTLGKIS